MKIGILEKGHQGLKETSRIPDVQDISRVHLLRRPLLAAAVLDPRHHLREEVPGRGRASKYR